jgi:hypothetical protein
MSIRVHAVPVVAAGRMWPLSTGNVLPATEALDFNFLSFQVA